MASWVEPGMVGKELPGSMASPGIRFWPQAHRKEPESSRRDLEAVMTVVA